MDNEFKNWLNKLVKEHGSAIVGRLLGQIDVLKKRKDLSEEQKFDILKSFNKELVYEEMRDFRKAIIYYSEGREYHKLPIYNPTKDSK